MKHKEIKGLRESLPEVGGDPGPFFVFPASTLYTGMGEGRGYGSDNWRARR